MTGIRTVRDKGRVHSSDLATGWRYGLNPVGVLCASLFLLGYSVPAIAHDGTAHLVSDPVSTPTHSLLKPNRIGDASGGMNGEVALKAPSKKETAKKKPTRKSTQPLSKLSPSSPVVNPAGTDAGQVTPATGATSTQAGSAGRTDSSSSKSAGLP